MKKHNREDYELVESDIMDCRECCFWPGSRCPTHDDPSFKREHDMVFKKKDEKTETTELERAETEIEALRKKVKILEDKNIELEAIFEALPDFIEADAETLQGIILSINNSIKTKKEEKS